jgi:hypothetical protein
LGSYPTDPAGRQQLADDLTAEGFKPTQPKQSFDRDKINKMVDAMLDGSFDWNKLVCSRWSWAPRTKSLEAIIG